MYNKLRPISVDILLDLDMYEEQYGSFIEKEPDPNHVRPIVDDTRTYILRDVLGPILFRGMLYERTGCKKNINPEIIKENAEYVLEYLKGDREVLEDETPNNFYYMKLKESNNNPNLFFLEIVLKSGFSTYMEKNPSEKMKIFLQGILQLLYENNLTDEEIVGYYMRLCLKGDESFENNFKSFLSGEI